MKERRSRVWKTAGLMFGICGEPRTGVVVAYTELARNESYVNTACANFSEDRQAFSGWRHVDCVDVWMAWTTTMPSYAYGPFPERDMLKAGAPKMRQQGSPCVVQSGAYGDGVGSSTIRHVASWMFADDVGCEWVTPIWNKRSAHGDGSDLYCHDTSTVAQRMEIRLGNAKFDPRTSRCSLHNWVAYFTFGSHSIKRPTNNSILVVEVRIFRIRSILKTSNHFAQSGIPARPRLLWIINKLPIIIVKDTSTRNP